MATKSLLERTVDLGYVTFKRWLAYLGAQNTPDARATLALDHDALQGAFVAGFVAGVESVKQSSRR